MGKFLLFAYSAYYPSGGVNDLEATGDSTEDVKNTWFKSLNESHYSELYWHVYDVDNDVITDHGKWESERAKEMNAYDDFCQMGRHAWEKVRKGQACPECNALWQIGSPMTMTHDSECAFLKWTTDQDFDLWMRQGRKAHEGVHN